MSCCGGGHSNNNHDQGQDSSLKKTFWTWLVGTIVVVSIIYFFNF